MASNDYGALVRNGLWSNNPSFVQLLGLCPLLAVSSTVANAVGLGLGTTLVLIGSNLTVSLIRNVVRPEVRIPVFVMVIASFVTALELAMNAFFYDLYKALGIFIPLIVTNCVIIGRAEAFASKNGVLPAVVDAVTMGLGLTFGLGLLGALREIVGQGTLFAHMDLMFGSLFKGATLTVISDYQGFLLATLPPGAFFGLGFLIALKNLIDRRQKRRSTQLAQTSEPVEVKATT